MKLKGSILIAVCLVFLVAPAVLADSITILDTTLVQNWIGGSGSDWSEVIGEVQFDTKKAVITRNGNDTVFQIYTNFPSSGLTVTSSTSVAPADLYITSGSTVMGVVMSAHDGYRAGDIISNPTWRKAQDLWGNGDWIYGGRYDQAAPKVTYTQVAGGSVTGSVPVTWTSLGLDSTQGVETFRIDIQHFQNVLAGNYSFFWGTGTCANDAIAGYSQLPTAGAGNVPLPSTILLLGSALAGIYFWRRRKAIKSAT